MNKGYTVEKIWLHKSNCCVVIMNHLSGCRCGYVGIPYLHPLHGLDYNQSSPYLNELRESLEKATINPGDIGVINLLSAVFSKDVEPCFIFKVHRGLTYSGYGDAYYPTTIWEDYQVGRSGFFSSLWWFGFDCAHAGDGHDIDQIFPESARDYQINFSGDIIRSLEYCISECESLSDQLEDLL